MPDGEVFEDILDGYFPLRVSIADLMRRRDLLSARLDLSFAPILAVEGLPPDAPVPLNIRSARAGMIDAAQLHAVLTGPLAALTGVARWRWLDGGPVAEWLDPMIRLAEPAIVRVQTLHTPAPDHPEASNAIASLS